MIINFLRSKHDICVNVRTHKRKLVKYKLSRNETWRSEEEVKNIIKEEMQGSELPVRLQENVAFA